jgi:apolipoprotein N-acyltransferase
VFVNIVQLLIAAVELYGVAGLTFAVMFLPRAVVRLDPRLAEAPKTVQLLILPGIVALWPLFAYRWVTHANEPIERNAHRVKARDATAVRRGSRAEVSQ